MSEQDYSIDTSWAGTDHSYADIREVDLRGKVLFQCDLRGAALYGAGITLNCDTFDGVMLDDHQMATLIRLIGLANCTPAWKTGLENLVIAIVGEERNKVLSRYLQIHI